MATVSCRVTILTPDGETTLPKQASSVSESALKAAGMLRTLGVVLGPDELPSDLLDPTVAHASELVVTYYLDGGETRTYSGDIVKVERRGSHHLVTFTPDS